LVNWYKHFKANKLKLKKGFIHLLHAKILVDINHHFVNGSWVIDFTKIKRLAPPRIAD
jgi:hypothetical protein